jgi:hypothetical protein
MIWASILFDAVISAPLMRTLPPTTKASCRRSPSKSANTVSFVIDIPDPNTEVMSVHGQRVDAEDLVRKFLRLGLKGQIRLAVVVQVGELAVMVGLGQGGADLTVLFHEVPDAVLIHRLAHDVIRLLRGPHPKSRLPSLL